MGIEREDWGDGLHTPNAVVPAGTVDVDSLPPPEQMLAEMQGYDVADHPAGSLVTDSFSPELRAIWSKEGGFELNFTQASTAATSILSRVSDPSSLQARFDALPVSIQNKAFDQLRMPPARNRGAAALKAFSARLTPAERQTFLAWCDQLSEEEEEAIMNYLDGKRAT